MGRPSTEVLVSCGFRYSLHSILFLFRPRLPFGFKRYNRYMIGEIEPDFRFGFEIVRFPQLISIYHVDLVKS